MSHPDLNELQQRLNDLETELRSLRRERRGRGMRTILLLGLVLTAATVGSALAANGNCPNGMPFCFAAGQPAKATEINHNFAQLKEWVEAKIGAVGSNVTVANAATFNNNISVAGSIGGASVSTSGAASFGGTGVVGGQLTANSGVVITAGGINVTGTTIASGYQTACVVGLSNYTYPVCCRMNVRNGAADCRVAGDWLGNGWTTGPGNLFSDTGVPGNYSITTYHGVSGQNYPAFCRTNNNTGSVTCRVSKSWAMNDWYAAGTVF